MKLHGAINANLQGAIASARRRQGHRVYADTIAYWNELLREARGYRTGSASDCSALDAMIVQLGCALIHREQGGKQRQGEES